MTDILVLIGRLLFGGLFLYNGINHFMARTALTGYAAFKGVPMPGVSIVISGVWLVIAGLSVMSGFRPEIGLAMIDDQTVLAKVMEAMGLAVAVIGFFGSFVSD